MRPIGRKPPVKEAELHEYVDGELDRERQTAVEAHLAMSPADSARVANWRRQNEAIRAAFPPLDAVQLPWVPLVLLEHGHGRLRQRWFAFAVAIAFVSGMLFAGCAIIVASRLSWLEAANDSPAGQAGESWQAPSQVLPGLSADGPKTEASKKVAKDLHL